MMKLSDALVSKQLWRTILEHFVLAFQPRAAFSHEFCNISKQ